MEADQPLHRGWYSRGYLPHLDEPDHVQGITFRLADSLPRSLLNSWQEDLRTLPRTPTNIERARRVLEALDVGHGHCWLRRTEIAALVEQALLQFDGERYRLLSWCIMPNHVHVLIESIEGYSLCQIISSWKSYTAHRANRILGRSGTFWARDYYDRFIRDDKHMEQAVAYIENNPVAAGIAHTPERWRWSSAWRRLRSA